MGKSRATAPRQDKTNRAIEPREDVPRFVEMIDLATKAKGLADRLGEKFLAYLLAMVIEEISHADSKRSKSRSAAERNRRSTAVPPTD